MATQSNSGKNSRLHLLSAVLVFWCVAICGRLESYLQIFSYGRFVKQAGHQQQRAIPLAAKSGVIYDRAGHELAMSVLVDSAFAVPTEVKDLPTAVNLITRITGDDFNVVLADCRAHKTFCWVARKANDETIQRINSLKLQGIHFQKEPKRFYPARDLAAQVLGSVGMEDSGQSGIEHEFDDELRGRAGKMFISVDARRQWFADVETQPDPGDNLVLTIDFMQRLEEHLVTHHCVDTVDQISGVEGDGEVGPFEVGVNGLTGIADLLGDDGEVRSPCRMDKRTGVVLSRTRRRTRRRCVEEGVLPDVEAGSDIRLGDELAVVGIAGRRAVGYSPARLRR